MHDFQSTNREAGRSEIRMARFARRWLWIAWVACAPSAATDDDLREVALAPAQAATPHPTRPLQRWMESELLFRIRTKDFRGLEHALEALASVAPAEYPHWAEVAHKASRAARDHDVEAVRTGCASCHQQYRTRYRHTAVDYDIARLIARSRI